MADWRLWARGDALRNPTGVKKFQPSVVYQYEYSLKWLRWWILCPFFKQNKLKKKKPDKSLPTTAPLWKTKPFSLTHMFTGRTKTGSFSAEGEVGKGPGRRSHALRGGLVRVRVIGTQQARDRASHTPGHPSCSARQKPTAARGLNLWTNTNRGVYFSLCGEGRNSPPLPLAPEFRWVHRMPSSYKKRVL